MGGVVKCPTCLKLGFEHEARRNCGVEKRRAGFVAGLAGLAVIAGVSPVVVHKPPKVVHAKPRVVHDQSQVVHKPLPVVVHAPGCRHGKTAPASAEARRAYRREWMAKRRAQPSP